MPTTGRNTEVDAYVFIKENLKDLGWDTRNPGRILAGQVYTQNECLSHPEIKAFLGTERPENVVKVSESVLWVIEAKRDHKQLGQALQEAEEYARKINKSKNVKVRFISGVAGNQTDSYLIQSRFWKGGKFQPITMNGKDISSLISPHEAKNILLTGPDIKDVPVNEVLFLTKAEKINQYLHLGAINKNYRARVMAALLLALIEDRPPNIDAAPSVLISEINARARHILGSQSKMEFFPFIEIALPSTEDNHIKFKTALVQTLQELNNLNIRSAMNSGADVLGKFYEVFLKYGNGAKEIGIVLTPRHITKFAVEVLGITDKDVVYDPTCGTGGFLVAAFDHVRRTSNAEQVNRFKDRLFGVEQEQEVVVLAIVNMIFRGDGKNNIIDGDCFQKHLIRSAAGAEWNKKPPKDAEPGATKVLMNPPFALRRSDEKEYRFVEHALSQMEDGGLLFCVLPYSSMVKPGGYLAWRKDSLLKHNTLLSVVTFPGDLFYPIGVHTLGIFVKKGVPHPASQNVLWVRAINDGLLKSKGTRLPNPRAKDDYAQIRSMVKAFVADPCLRVIDEEQFQRACPIDFADPILELVPENYLEQSLPTPAEISDGIEQVIRDCVSYLIQARKENEW